MKTRIAVLLNRGPRHEVPQLSLKQLLLFVTLALLMVSALQVHLAEALRSAH
jgi:hypothetical protein